jgi:hypothetical protein
VRKHFVGQPGVMRTRGEVGAAGCMSLIVLYCNSLEFARGQFHMCFGVRRGTRGKPPRLPEAMSVQTISVSRWDLP